MIAIDKRPKYKNSIFLAVGYSFHQQSKNIALNIVPIWWQTVGEELTFLNFIQCAENMFPENLKDFSVAVDLLETKRKRFELRRSLINDGYKKIAQSTPIENFNYDGKIKLDSDLCCVIYTDPKLMVNGLAVSFNDYSLDEPWQERAMSDYVKDTMTTYVKNIDKLPKYVADKIKYVINNPGDNIDKNIVKYFQGLLR